MENKKYYSIPGSKLETQIVVMNMKNYIENDEKNK